MICLNAGDILNAAPLNDVLDAVEGALRLCEAKTFEMPLRTHVEHEGNTLLLMPCFTPDAFGTKLVTLFPKNPEKGLPVLEGVMVLNDAETGAPLALLNGKTLTALRTGAAGAVSIRHLTPESIRTVGIVGAGVQGFSQAQCAAAARQLSDIYVFDCCSEKVPGFVERLSAALPGVAVHQAASVEELLAASEAVITSTTSQEPVLPDDGKLLAGKHFVGIGSYKPAMRELPEALFRLLDIVYVDTEHALEESGDLCVPLEKGWIERDQVSTVGRLIIEGGASDEARSATSLFKSVGMALFDVCVSRLIYERAVEQGLGQEINL